MRYGSSIEVPGRGATNQRVLAACDPGEVAVAGGALIGPPASGDSRGERRTFVVFTVPTSNGEPPAAGTRPDGWLTSVTNTSADVIRPAGVPSRATPYVVCA